MTKREKVQERESDYQSQRAREREFYESQKSEMEKKPEKEKTRKEEVEVVFFSSLHRSNERTDSLFDLALLPF